MASGGTPYTPGVPGVAPTVRAQRPQAITRGLGGPGPAKKAPGRQPPQKGTPKGRPAPAAKPATAPRTPFYGGEIPNYGGLASRGQLQQVGAPIHAAEEGERNLARTGFRAQRGEQNFTENQILNREQGMTGGTQAYLQGLVQGSEGSAKTANNYAAESALSAQRNVETAGQNAQTNIGGFAPTQLGEAQAFQRGTAERGEANTAALRQIAAGAAVQGQQGAANVRGRFATERARTQTAENQAQERIGIKGKNARLEAGQKLFTDLLGLKTLEQRGQLGAAKNALTGAKLNIEKQKANTGERAQRTKSYVEEAKLILARGEFNRRWAETKNKASKQAFEEVYKTASLKQKGELDNQNVKYKEAVLQQKAQAIAAKAGGIKPTAASWEKFRISFGRALNAFEKASFESGKKTPNWASVRQQLATGYELIEGKPKKVGGAVDPLAVNAAFEAWTKHEVGASTKAALGQLGLPTTGWSELIRRG